MRIKKYLIALCIVCVVSGCGEKIKRTLGIKRANPDEFTILAHAPLIIPEQFDLPPPQRKHNVRNMDHSAGHYEHMFVADAATNYIATGGEHNVHGIREQIDSDNEPEYEENFLKRKYLQIKSDKGYHIVDAKAEQERLEELRQRNKPINSSEVKLIHKRSSWLKRMLSDD